MSPLYDLLCTLHYGDNRLAMYIDDVRRTDRVTGDRIVTEATRWGMGRAPVTNTINDLLVRAGQAITAARDETDAVPDDVLVIVRQQLDRLTAEQL